MTGSHCRRFVCLLGALAVLGGLTGGRTPAARAQEGETAPSRKTYRMPAVAPGQFLKGAADSTRAILRPAQARPGDRQTVFRGIRAALDQQDRLAERVAAVYPRNQMEWIVITDFAADTLATQLGPILSKYSEANPQEILTEGRQLLELEQMSMPSLPDRMLGFHISMLARFLYARHDSILAAGRTADRAGLEDGVLRSLQDWVRSFDQAHADVVEKHTSHLKHEDWVMIRLEDNCGNKGSDVWQIKNMYMAKVGVDSSSTPPLEMYAHEYHVESVKCAGDNRVVYFDLPLLQYTLMEAHRRAQQKDLELQEETRREREARERN